MAESENETGMDVDPVGREMYEYVLKKKLTGPLDGVRQFTVNELFAKVWSRSRPQPGQHPSLGLKERRLITIALLAAQGRADQLEEHLVGARAEISKEELLELMIHVSHYAGWAAGTGAQKIVERVYGEENDIETAKI